MNLKQPIEDFDVDCTRNMLCVCSNKQILIYQLNSLRLFRAYRVAIELGKASTMKFLENQVCLGSGITLEFFPLGGSLQRFTQQINFSSYWDRISVVDYVVNNGAEMLLIVGTLCGMLCLFNSSFKELY